MNLLTKITDFVGGGLFKEAKNLITEYWPPDVSPEKRAEFIAKVWFGYEGDFPIIDTTITMQVLFGMLGFGGFRSYEKIKGVASNSK